MSSLTNAAATLPRLSESVSTANRSMVATWTRPGSDVGLEVRAFHSPERREYWVSVSRFVEVREDGRFAVRQYAPMEDVQVSSRIPTPRYSQKNLRAAYDTVSQAVTADLDFWLGWADKINRQA